MQKIEINLASPDGASGARFYKALMIAGACLAAVYTFYNARVYIGNKKAVEVYRQRVADAEAKKPKKPVQPPQPAQAAVDVDLMALKKDVAVINEIIDRKSFMWTNLLTRLEMSAPPNVYLIQISPDFKKSNVTVTGAARTMTDVLSMVERMGRSPYFKDVFLLRHAEEKPPAQLGVPVVPQAQGIIIFSVSARYLAGENP